MRNDRHLAEELRRKGHSYNSIVRELGVPKGTLSEWFGGEPWSERVKKRLIVEARPLWSRQIRAMAKAQQVKWAAWRRGYRVLARRKFRYLFRDPLFVSGMMLYWGEGDSKSRGTVRLANTDPRMVRLFVRFLRRCCGVPREKIFIHLILYPDLTPERENRFWSASIGLPLSQVGKAQVIQSRTFNGAHPSKRLEHGVCLVSVNSTGLKEQMRVWQTLCYRTLLKIPLRV